MPVMTGGDAQREPRTSVMLLAELEHFGLRSTTLHRVRDISCNGALIDRAEPLRPGETVALSIGEEVKVAATVIWCRGGLAGIRFAQPIRLERARARTMVREAKASGDAHHFGKRQTRFRFADK